MWFFLCSILISLPLLLEMVNNLNSTDILLEMSIPNRAGILTPIDGLEEGEEITMLVMPVMLSD